MRQGEHCFTLTGTPKTKNEDAHASFQNKYFSGVVIADGLGSYAKAAEASSVAVLLFSERVVAYNEETIHEGLYRLFSEIEEDLIKIGKDNNDTNAYATTLLVAILLPKETIVAYVGNGAIFHLYKHMKQCKTNGLLSWGAANYLIPHTINQNGKEALYRYLSSEEHSIEKSKPTIVRINREFDNSMIVLATDGLYSSDQVEAGKVKQTDQTFVLYENRFIGFLEIVEQFYGGQFDSLPRALEEYFEEIKESLDDDTTIGVLIDKG